MHSKAGKDIANSAPTLEKRVGECGLAGLSKIIVGTLSMAWTREDAAHLLRRVGFGGSTQQVETLYAKGRAAAVESLLNYECVTDPAWEIANPLGLKDPVSDPWDASLTLLYRFLASTRPLEARLTWFWHTHFAPAMQVAGNPLMALQFNTWRQHAAGHFKDFLPAMYQNGVISRRLHHSRTVPLAYERPAARTTARVFALDSSRETMPVAARAPASVPVAPALGGTAHVRRALAQKQPEPTLSRDEPLHTLYDRPDTMRTVCAKLYQAFVRDRVTPADLDMLMNVWGRSGGSIKSVMSAMLRANYFWDAQLRGTVMKGAMEYAAGLVQRLDLGLNRALVENIALSLPKMGHVPFQFGDPARVRTAMQLSSTGVLLARYEFARYAIYGVGPGRVASSMTAGFPRRAPPNVFITLLAQRLGLALLTTATRSVVNEYLGNDPISSDAKPDKVLGALYLFACSPEYQAS